MPACSWSTSPAAMPTPWLAMMLTLSKQLIQSDHALRGGSMHDRRAFTGNDVHGRTIGIVGLGNVGRRVAELCCGLFAMQVIACDPYLDEATVAARGAVKVTLEDLGAPTSCRSTARSTTAPRA